MHTQRKFLPVKEDELVENASIAVDKLVVVDCMANTNKLKIVYNSYIISGLLLCNLMIMYTPPYLQSVLGNKPKSSLRGESLAPTPAITTCTHAFDANLLDRFVNI